MLDRLHLQDVAHLDVQQNLDVAHLDVAHLDALHPLDAEVVAELRHQLRMDYFLDAVDVELRHQMRMDYFQDAADVELRYLKRMDYFQDAALVLLALAQPEFLIQN